MAKEINGMRTQLVIAHHRAAGSSSIYIGPFEDEEAVDKFAKKHPEVSPYALYMLNPDDCEDANGHLKQEVWC